MTSENQAKNKSAATSDGAKTTKAGDGRLDFLDGLRALAALYVTLHHMTMWRSRQAYHIAALGWIPLQYGHYAVDLFIVLSGFCLAISLARRSRSQIEFREYILRRARRILPPYYAALVFALGILAVRNLAGFDSKGDFSVPVTPASLGAHLLLLHNWSPEWVYKINGPLWSVAVEWQLYFFFPFLMGMAYRWRLLPTVLATMGFGVALHFLPGSPLDMTVPWYLGLFAVGIAAAIVVFDPAPRYARLRERGPWGLLTLAALLASLVTLHFVKATLAKNDGSQEAGRFLFDPALGIAVGFLLVWLSTPRPGSLALIVQRGLSWKPLVALGVMSYSLYLTHGPLVDLLGRAILPTLPSLSRDTALFAMLACLPAVIGVAYLFHCAFEKPFIARPKPRLRLETNPDAPRPETLPGGEARETPSLPSSETPVARRAAGS